MPKFIIFSPRFDPNNGGSIVLHKLCSVLNKLGYEAELYSFYQSELIHKENWFRPTLRMIKSGLKSYFEPYTTNPHFQTPTFKGNKRDIRDTDIVVYPDMITGNPLGAKNVVRWLLHKPGFHTGRVYFGEGELYFDFNSFAGGFNFPGSKVSSLKLYIPHIPIEIYNMDNVLPEEQRKGTAYCLRKGKHKTIVHELDESILIDGKSHHEIAEIFKRVKTFISYDAYTGYSMFAALCGAESVVIPDQGVSESEWYPEESQRYGIAYGFENMAFARLTISNVLNEVLEKENQIDKTVEQFVNEVADYFNLEFKLFSENIKASS